MIRQLEHANGGAFANLKNAYFARFSGYLTPISLIREIGENCGS